VFRPLPQACHFLSCVFDFWVLIFDPPRKAGLASACSSAGQIQSRIVT
jgi:hypothetical protein